MANASVVDEGPRIVLPNNPFWLLNVQVKEDGAQVPFGAQMLYAYQWRWPSFAEQPDTTAFPQADGTP